MFSKLTLIIGVFVMILCFLFFSSFVESNSAGFIQVKQSALAGDMTVKSTPGTYSQLFGTITTYKISDTVSFGEGTLQPVTVRFNDASVAQIPGQFRYILPTSDNEILKIHKDFRSDDAVKNMIAQTIAAAMRQSATYFRAEEIYSTRKSEFNDLINDQIRRGIFATTYIDETSKTELGESIVLKRVRAKLDSDGVPIVNEESNLRIYGIQLVPVGLGDPDFDEKTDGLIAKRKEAEQERVVAIANAERAKQDAITAVEQGKANIATAEASALVSAKKEIVEAEKNTKVAEQNAMQAEQEKKAIIARGEADATATRLKVAAGLSPLEQAMIAKETAIGVAQAMATVKLPGVMIIGGGEKNGSQLNPFDAVGLESFQRIAKNITNEEVK